MWRNSDVVEFVAGCAVATRAPTPARRRASMVSISTASSRRLRRSSRTWTKSIPDAARRARARYACFRALRAGHAGVRLRRGRGLAESCEDDAVEQLMELRRRAAEYASATVASPKRNISSRSRIARLALNAERYYRAMFRGSRVLVEPARHPHGRDARGARSLLRVARPTAEDRRVGAQLASWRCARDRDGASRRDQRGAARARAVCQCIRVGWLHDVCRNRHGGDRLGRASRAQARARCAAGERGGCAAPDGVPKFLLRFDDPGLSAFTTPLLERAIGVIYLPQTERQSHYFHARVADQFDALIHIDHTTAVEPLERTAPWTTVEPPETYPSAV